MNREEFAKKMFDLWNHCAHDENILKSNSEYFKVSREEMQKVFLLTAKKTLTANDPTQTDLMTEALKEIIAGRS